MKVTSKFVYSRSGHLKRCSTNTEEKKKEEALVMWKLYRIEPPCVTTSHRWPPPISDRNPKYQNFPSQSLQWRVGTSCKQPTPASNCNHFLGLMVNDFPLFLTSCKRPLDTFSNLYVCCVHYATENVWRTSVSAWNYTWLSRCTWISSRKRPLWLQATTSLKQSLSLCILSGRLYIWEVQL